MYNKTHKNDILVIQWITFQYMKNNLSLKVNDYIMGIMKFFILSSQIQ